MQVAKWGNSLAVRLPSAVVEALELKEGDQIEIRVAGKREFEIARDRSAEKALRTDTAVAASFASRFQVRPSRSE
jgi:antitoxin MazE